MYNIGTLESNQMTRMLETYYVIVNAAGWYLGEDGEFTANVENAERHRRYELMAAVANSHEGCTVYGPLVEGEAA